MTVAKVEYNGKARFGRVEVPLYEVWCSQWEKASGHRKEIISKIKK
jgi:hypothetical protein